MAPMLENFKCDIVLFATPLYVDNVTGLMKNFMDRMIPIVDLLRKRPERRVPPLHEIFSRNAEDSRDGQLRIPGAKPLSDARSHLRQNRQEYALRGHSEDISRARRTAQGKETFC